MENFFSKDRKLLQEAQNIAHVGSWEYDFTTGISSWSDELYRILGYEPAEAPANFESFASRVHPDDLQRIITAFNNFAESAEPLHEDIRIVRHEGQVRHVRFWLRRVLGADGGVAQMLGTVQDITERKRTEEALIKSAIILKDAQELAHVGNWEYDLSSGSNYWSDVFYRILGYAPGEIEPTFENFFKHVHPEDQENFFSQHMTDDIVNLDFRIIQKSGEERFVTAMTRAVTDSADTPARVHGVLVDITERKRMEQELRRSHDDMEIMIRERTAALKIANRKLQSELAERNRAEHALRESESQLRSILYNMQDAYFRTDTGGLLTMVNPAAALMYGYDGIGEMIGLSAAAFYAGDTERNAVLAEIGERGAVHHRIVRGRKKDGTIFWISLNAQQCRDWQSRVTGTEGFARDITRSMEAEEALRQSEQQVRGLLEKSEQARRALASILEDVQETKNELQESEALFRSILETANDAIVAVNGDGVIRLWNSAAEKIFGYQSSEALGMSFAAMIPERLRGEHSRRFQQVAAGNRMTLGSGCIQGPGLRKDGSEFIVETTLSLIKKNTGMLITMVVRDVTERKLIEQEAMRTAQLASIGELAAGVAHEINNPIMGVINYAQIMLNRAMAAGGDTDIPARIIKEGERIARIVKNLLTFARQEQDTPMAVSVQPILEDSFALVHKGFLQSGVIITQQLPAGLPRILVVPQKIQQVFINIMSNAQYALNEKYPSGEEHKTFDITGETIAAGQKQYVRMTFHDNGCGIPADSIDKVCNPFFTTKPVGKGTGLGLSICHSIINEHQGRLFFESRPGEYTKVIVDLPAEA